jgi:hypothetical protein
LIVAMISHSRAMDDCGVPSITTLNVLFGYPQKTKGMSYNYTLKVCD